MDINTKLRLGTIAIADVVAGGAIGTAANTVDASSSFHVTQTTAGQTLSLPVPTNPSVGQIVAVANLGTASFVMHGMTVEAGTGTLFQYDGTNWVPLGDIAANRNYYAQHNFVALTGLVVTHNFNLATPRQARVSVRDSVSGEDIMISVTAYSANDVTLLSNVAIANADVYVNA